MRLACHWFGHKEVDGNAHILQQESRWYTLKCLAKILPPELLLSEYQSELNYGLGSL